MSTKKPIPAPPAKPVDFDEALERYRDYLKRKKLLFTRERIAILEEVMARHDHFSVEGGVARHRLFVQRQNIFGESELPTVILDEFKCQAPLTVAGKTIVRTGSLNNI